ncbi:phosphoenolpyruvate carboxykinase (ATP) [Sediminibacillus halophilus]|uniref:Phosphoenolpyruvate carboxykinase (ATP) n=2 Tax=Sediminibacillus halophilus TaxID=482461 RepID=A0A1G9QN13_9BACI|nr:phosphoenolpyruvate carboxykinase (ATP) [Sediminibacillus halophilus]
MNPTNESASKMDKTILQNCQVNLSTEALVEIIEKRGEGTITANGAVSVTTGKYTGRSPKDKFIVNEGEAAEQVDWGSINKPMDKNSFIALYERVLEHLRAQDTLFRFTGWAGADTDYRLPIEVITEFAWHNLFARQLFIREDNETAGKHNAFTVISAPTFKANPKRDNTNSEAFIIISFEERIILIGGTEYAGEIKKAVFSVMNYLLPQQEVLPMHCSANTGASGDTALFFGLSGTGKTTLSANPDRRLIGDDEHGWSPNGIFNIEGGCYAKCVGLSEEKEPQIYHAIKHGAVLENVFCHNGMPDYSNTERTENTRAAYPLAHIDNSIFPSKGPHPKSIIFLTADAFGVLPPISKLTKEQAMYHFLSGYTSKLAGTERGITAPEATFSACFGSPFLPLAPAVYADMLGEKIDQYDADVYLINTGWIKGPFGIGERIPLVYTRAMVNTVLEQSLEGVDTVPDDYFGLHIPESIPGVPSQLLKPWESWESYSSYQVKAAQLAAKFHENFRTFTKVSEKIKNAGPVYQG